MIFQPYRLYVERSDTSKNMARYYAMSIEPNLFGDICLLRRWGRIGARGQMIVHYFGREEEAVRLFLELLRQKRKRGYRPRHPLQNSDGCRYAQCRTQGRGSGSGSLGADPEAIEPTRLVNDPEDAGRVDDIFDP